MSDDFRPFAALNLPDRADGGLLFVGGAVVCVDDPNVRAILPRVDRRVLTYGLSSEADLSATEVSVAGFSVSGGSMTLIMGETG